MLHPGRITGFSNTPLIGGGGGFSLGGLHVDFKVRGQTKNDFLSYTHYML